MKLYHLHYRRSRKEQHALSTSLLLPLPTPLFTVVNIGPCIQSHGVLWRIAGNDWFMLSYSNGIDWG